MCDAELVATDFVGGVCATVCTRAAAHTQPLFCSAGPGVVADRCPFFLAVQFITLVVVGDLWLCPDAHRTKCCGSSSVFYQTAGELKKKKKTPSDQICRRI